MPVSLEERVEQAVGRRPTELRPLSGGCVGEVARAEFADGEPVVVKHASPGDGAILDVEGRMLAYLAERSDLPVPSVIHAESTLLVLEHIDSSRGGGTGAEEHAADLLVELHAISSDHHGLEFDTLIGGLHQPNDPEESWIDFFRERRLLEMARQGVDAGRLPFELHTRLRRLAGDLDRFLDEPQAPSLIHGDIWSGNVLTRGDRVAAFIDPAVYYADAEIELAFITLFGTFGRRFFDRYAERRPIREGFFEQRRDLLNLYPLLVHVRLFGGAYVSSVDRILRSLGY